MSNQVVEKLDKGKLKKWKKRVDNGEIQDGQLYNTAHGTFGLMGKPSLIFNNVISTTDIDVKYIREFIYTTLLQDFVNMRPKAVEVKNRGYIRNVVIALVCGCCSPSTMSNGCDSTTRKVRISRRNTQLQCLCDKVLTFPIDEFRDEELEQLEKRAVLESEQGEDELFRRLLSCKMSSGQLSLWGYPIPRPLHELSAMDEEGKGEELSRPMKKPRIEEIDEKSGIEREIVSHNIAESLLQLHRTSFPLTSIASDISNASSTSGNNFISAYRPPLGYFETLSLHNLSTFQAQLNTSWSKPMKIASLDCEMLDVRDVHAPSGIRREVVRITVLDAYKRSVLEAIVHPLDAALVRTPSGSQDCDLSCVVDFKESFSGVSRNTLRTLMLTGQTISQQQLIATLLTMFSAETVLVGHGLENDLRCVGIAHGRVVDTAALFPHPRGFPYRLSLKQLAKKHLNLQIQQNHATGHCSAEDSAAAWQLACHAANQRATGIFLSGNVANTGGDVTLPVMEERVSLIKRLQTQVQSHKDGKSETSFGSVLTWVCDVEGGAPTATAMPTVEDTRDADVLSIEDDADPDVEEEDDAQEIDGHTTTTAMVESTTSKTRPPIVYRGRQHMIFASLAQQYDKDVTDVNENPEDFVDYHRAETVAEGCDQLSTFLSDNEGGSSQERKQPQDQQQMRFAVLHVPSPRDATSTTVNESYEVDKIRDTVVSTIRTATVNNGEQSTNGHTLLLFLHQPDTAEALAIAHQRYLALHGGHASEGTQARHGQLTGLGDTLRHLRSAAVTWDASQEQEYHLLLQRLHMDIQVSLQIV